jgi:hypothetical protein
MFSIVRVIRNNVLLLLYSVHSVHCKAAETFENLFKLVISPRQTKVKYYIACYTVNFTIFICWISFSSS